MGWHKPVAAALLVTLAAVGGASGAKASDAGRLTLIEENDAFASSDDRHYTQGLRLSYLSGDIAPGSGWNRPFDWLSNPLPLLPNERSGQTRKIEWIVIGQSLFTPADLHLFVPDPHDRPYAGWLYTGASLLVDDDGKQLSDIEILAGVVGPSALGKQTQNDFHAFIKVGQSHGWGYQLNDEPGLVLSDERKWRFEQPLLGNLAVDIIPEVGASLGNVLTYGEMGGTIRLGQNLGADYGQPHIRPSLSGSGYFNADRMETKLGWYVFAGVQGRAVGRNIFLDGNTWQNSRSVEKKPLVGDIVVGASVFWTDKIRADFSITQRSKEYYGQPFKDTFGAITLSVLFW